ncbi:hypothetical protein SOPP22_04470 [Shewanella sp. OPT22]|nr:hypothetical protein SOPP22_04470 [Shewanella sp. OPT22]
MIKRIFWLSLATVMLPVLANVNTTPKDKLIQQAALIIEEGLSSTPLSCLGISKIDFNNVFKDAKHTCGEQLPERIEQAEKEQYVTEFGNCVTSGLRSHFDIPQATIDRCETAAYSPSSSLKEAAKRLNQGLKMHASQSDIGQVTLPLYMNHRVVSHFPDGMGNVLGTSSLPVAVFATDDDISNVINFYQTQLPDFKKFTVENGVIFIEDAPADFDLLTHIGLYTSTPHVLIEDMRFNEITAQEGDVKIEVSYRK